MGRQKSRLNSVIDVEIAKLFESVGSADATTIFETLRSDHDEMVQAELVEDARRGLMRRIELRLKQFVTESDDDQSQVVFPGLSPFLLERINETITVPREDGSCTYLYIRHPNTKVGDVVAHIGMLRGKEESLNAKIVAWQEVVQRCGAVDPEMSLMQALAAAAPVRASASGSSHQPEARP